MTKEEAINIIKQATEKIVADLATHRIIQEAIKTLEDIKEEV